jgi:bacterioferritin-associated ferredoxin
MIVCLCNAFTDRQVRAAYPIAGCSAARVYRALGVQPKCGKCVPMVRQIVSELGNMVGTAPAAAAAEGSD